MLTAQRFSILIVAVFFSVSTVIVPVNLAAQSGDTEEMSIEESYLQESIELMIIRETSRSDSRDQKLVALEHIESALERGNTNDEIRVTLEYLTLEGNQNRIMQNKRLVNNFPDIRRQAAKLLADVGTKEAKSALIRVCSSEAEPLVIQEAIKSLGIIGLNDNNDAVNAIVHVTGKMHNTDIADNLVALAAMDALEKLVVNSKSIEVTTIQLIAKIADGSYAVPVKERAKQVLLNIRNQAAANSAQKSE